jgi:threonine dehydrogenase-like Zn-dependent dehydrogenase
VSPPTTMLAVRAHPHSLDVHLDTVGVPEPGPDDVLVKIGAAGVSPGMLRVLEMGRFRYLPSTLGPDGAGTVAAVGTNVQQLDIGDRVRIHPNLNCRRCIYCRTDRDMMCPELAIMGHGAFGRGPLPLYARYHDGALAEYALAPYWQIDPLPDIVSFEVGAKLNHLATAARAIKCANLRPGATVVITAATGSIGAATARLAKIFGLARVVLVGRGHDHLEAVSTLADNVATDVVATNDLPDTWTDGDGLTHALRELLPDGADAVIDYAPTGPTVQQATAALATGGTLVHLGSNNSRLSWPLATIMMNCWRIVGIRGTTRTDTDQILDLLRAGVLTADALITHRYALNDTPNAIHAIQARNSAQPMWMVIATP